MVDSRAKGARGEYLVRDILREFTGYQFERVPSSGALEYLKGDLYVPHAKNKYCIEVKNYESSPLSDKILEYFLKIEFLFKILKTGFEIELLILLSNLKNS